MSETAIAIPTVPTVTVADTDQQALAAALDATQAPPPAPCTVGQVVAAYRRGLKGLCRGCLESGRLAYDLVHYRTYVTKTHTREAAVDAIRGQLSDVAGRSVDVNALIATWHATRLLHVNGDPCETPLPYSTLEELRVLVERDSETDEWQLKADVAEEALVLYPEACATTPPMTLAKVAERVAGMVAKAKRAHAQELAEQAKAPESTEEQREEAAKALEQAGKAEERAQKLAEKAKGKAKKAKTGPAQDRQELPRMDKPGSAEETGRLAADFVLTHPEPTDCLEAFLRQLKARKDELDAAAGRAVDAALLILAKAGASEKAVA